MKTLKQFLDEGQFPSGSVHDDPKHQKALDKIRRKALRAYRKHGTIRNQEWRDAAAEHDAYIVKHKLHVHNPD